MIDVGEFIFHKILFMSCYCSSGKDYKNCCEPFHKGVDYPDTPLKLMRSRFSAFATSNSEYLIKSSHPDLIEDVNEEDLKLWAEQNDWKSLEIIETTKDHNTGLRGEVEFKANYVDEIGRSRTHHERSIFYKVNNKWLYHSGDINPKKINVSTKTRRNDPCPCGSGLKYKKCCLSS